MSEDRILELEQKIERLKKAGSDLAWCAMKLGTQDHDSMEVLDRKEEAIQKWREVFHNRHPVIEAIEKIEREMPDMTPEARELLQKAKAVEMAKWV